MKHSSTEAPIELRRVSMEVTIVHLFTFGSYRSTELSDEEPSLPPSAYRNPFASTTSCVDLWIKWHKKNAIRIASLRKTNQRG